MALVVSSKVISKREALRPFLQAYSKAGTLIRVRLTISMRRQDLYQNSRELRLAMPPPPLRRPCMGSPPFQEQYPELKNSFGNYSQIGVKVCRWLQPPLVEKMVTKRTDAS